jgi:hypothetical protein
MQNLTTNQSFYARFIMWRTNKTKTHTHTFEPETTVKELKTKVIQTCNHALNPCYEFSKKQLLDLFRELKTLIKDTK